MWIMHLGDLGYGLTARELEPFIGRCEVMLAIIGVTNTIPRGSVRGGGKPNVGVLVFEPGERQAIDLGHPVPALPEYVQLTAIINTSDDTIYGLIGPAAVYGLPGRPVHIYSVACKTCD